ncbi:hypothetical protein BSKO_06613 [Bryopsis sp. KO-2023]|nr:hypothetical protein BSKO_06613 [Bryopsis sp. KO-2023]
MEEPILDYLDAPNGVRAVHFHGRRQSGLRITGVTKSFKQRWAAISALYLLIGGVGFVVARVSEFPPKSTQKVVGGVWLGIGVLLVLRECFEHVRGRDVDIIVGRTFFACSQHPIAFVIAQVRDVRAVSSSNVQVAMSDGALVEFFRGNNADIAAFIVQWMKDRMSLNSEV